MKKPIMKKPIMKIVKRYWKFKLEEVYMFKLRSTTIQMPTKLRVNNRVFGSVDAKGVVTIFPGYAWDGCSPKYIFFGILVLGTPDGRKGIDGNPVLYHPSLKHDVLCQFRDTLELKQSTIDDWFLRDMRLHKVSILRRFLYYKSVRIFQTVTHGKD